MTTADEPSKRNSAHSTNFLHVGPLLLILLCDVFALENGEVCTNPEGVRGTCINVRSCTPLLSVLQMKPLSQVSIDFLRKSQCGVFQDRDPLVCCPPDDRPPSFTTPRPGGGTEGEVTEDVSQHRNLGLLRMDICGPVTESRILIGPEFNIMELPWMALLAYNVQSGSPFKCGGSIINERYVLTAAHCVTGLQRNISLVSVRLGEHNLTSPIDCEMAEEARCAPAPQNIPVQRVIPHPRYVGMPNLQYDIALVRLSRPANFTHEAVQPICLPMNIDQQTQDLIGKKVYVSGWGAKENSQPSPVRTKFSVPVKEESQCTRMVRGAPPISMASQMCAGGVGGGRDTCLIDSGGALTYFLQIQKSTRAIQHGIFSYGQNACGLDEAPGVFTRVGHFMEWILDTIEP